MSVLRATVVLEADPDKVRRFLESIYDPEIPTPEPDVWFASRVQELIEDDFSVAVMMGPIEVSLGEFE